MNYSNDYSKNALASISKYIGRHNLNYGFGYRVINSGPSVAYNSGTFSFNGVFSREYLTQSAIANSFSFLDPNKAGAGTVYQYSMDIQREIGRGICRRSGLYWIALQRPHAQPDRNRHSADQPDRSCYYGAGAVIFEYVRYKSILRPAWSRRESPTQLLTAQLLLPFPEYTTISENTTISHARYDSLVVKVQKTLSHGITFLSTLTWSRNEDNEWSTGGGNALNGLGGVSGGGIQNIYNINAEWAGIGTRHADPLDWLVDVSTAFWTR